MKFETESTLKKKICWNFRINALLILLKYKKKYVFNLLSRV